MLHLKLIILLSASILLVLLGCSRTKASNEIVIYTSVDQVYASKIFRDFEQKTGLKVLAVFDTEASKAIGLEKRLRAEKSHPRADVFWNSEPLRTLKLAKEGIFQPFSDIQPPSYKRDLYSDKEKRWFALGERVRVIIVNTKKLKPKEYPYHFSDIWAKRNKGDIALSSPFSGTTATHFAALHYRLGADGFKHLLNSIKSVNATYLSGNSVVKDAVGSGKYSIGLVDSDDALAGIKSGMPIEMIYYNQDADGMFAIFGTVAMLHNAPHLENAKKFMTYILTKEVEKKLIKMGAVQFSVFKNDTEGEKIKSWAEEPKHLLDDLQKSYILLKENL